MKRSVSYVQNPSSSPVKKGFVTQWKFWVLILTEGCWSIQVKWNQIAKTVQEKSKIVQVGKVVLGLATSHDEEAGIVKAGTLGWSDPVFHDCGSFAQCGPTIMPHSPEYKIAIAKKKERRGLTFVQMVHTHITLSLTALSHTQHCHTQLFHTIRLPPSPLFYLHFRSHFHICFLFISGHVGLIP